MTRNSRTPFQFPAANAGQGTESRVARRVLKPSEGEHDETT